MSFSLVDFSSTTSNIFQVVVNFTFAAELLPTIEYLYWELLIVVLTKDMGISASRQFLRQVGKIMSQEKVNNSYFTTTAGGAAPSMVSLSSATKSAVRVSKLEFTIVSASFLKLVT